MVRQREDEDGAVDLKSIVDVENPLDGFKVRTPTGVCLDGAHLSTPERSRERGGEKEGEKERET